MRIFVLFGVSLFLLLCTPQAYANSSYVLPYPGVMPGNKLYKISEIVDEINGIFSVGDFARFKYNLSQADKYLVTSKTLFEYGQYPKAVDALKKSDTYFKKLKTNLTSAKNNNKDITEKNAVFQSASEKHIEILTKLSQELPQAYNWQDEKMSPYTIDIKEEIKSAIKDRK